MNTRGQRSEVRGQRSASLSSLSLEGRGQGEGASIRYPISDIRYRCPSGFTLLEVLVALSILGIAVVVIFQLFSANTSAIAASEKLVNATAKLESRMQEVIDDDLAEGSWSETTSEGYVLDIDVSEAIPERTSHLPVKLLEITMTIHWRTGMKERNMTVKTLRLVNRKV